MAKLRDLLRALEATRLDPKTLRETARRLQEAGLISKGKTGRYGGASMTPKDGSPLVIALIGPGDRRDVIQSPRTVELCSSMVIQKYTDHTDTIKLPAPPPEHFYGLKEGHTFGEAITALISAAYMQELEIYRMDVGVRRSPWPSGFIDYWGMTDERCGGHLWKAHYSYPIDKNTETKEKIKQMNYLFGEAGGLYETTRSVPVELFSLLGECLRGEAMSNEEDEMP